MRAPRSGGRPRPSSQGLSGCGLRGPAGLCPEGTRERLQPSSATGTGAGGRCRARPGRGLGAALGYGRGPGARTGRWDCVRRAAALVSFLLRRAQAAWGRGVSAALCCPPGARPPRLVLHCPLAARRGRRKKIGHVSSHAPLAEVHTRGARCEREAVSALGVCHSDFQLFLLAAAAWACDSASSP